MRVVATSTHLLLYARYNKKDFARLGIVVAKRFAPRAVTRNAIKRICREVFRITALPSFDFVIRLRANLNKKSETAVTMVMKETIRNECTLLFKQFLEKNKQ